MAHLSTAVSGIRDTLIVCCDRLTGLLEGIEATWPAAAVQTCAYAAGGDGRPV